MKSVFLKTLCVIGLAGVVAAPAAMAVESLRVVRDPQTGALRAPTAAELKEMTAAEASKPASAPLVVRQSANGTKTVRLPAEYLVESQAHVDADGKVTISHNNPAMAHEAATAVEK